jgi:hypothetical protein
MTIEVTDEMIELFKLNHDPANELEQPDIRSGIAAVLALVKRGQSGEAMYKRAYFGVSDVLDKALGPDEEDGAGEGLVADVMLLAHRYDLALKALEAAGASTVAGIIRRSPLPE